jgi:predicted  nucleic acid-binding Zn ribbon protein
MKAKYPELTCTCGMTAKNIKSNKNITCPKCKREYYLAEALGKWLFTGRQKPAN